MYDVAVIGAGVIGSAVARELMYARLDVVVLERGSDVASGASKANSGIVHAGYDAKPGSRKAWYNRKGNPKFEALSAELDFPFKRNGSLVLAFGADERAGLEALLERGRKNGVPGLRIVEGDEARALEPNLAPEVSAALYAPTGGIVCPYEMTIALAENAAANGAEFRFNHDVRAVVREAGGFRIEAVVGEGGESGGGGGKTETIRARVLVNAAGIGCAEINNQLGAGKMKILPRKGEYLLLDRSEDGLMRHTLFQLPGPLGKGVLVAPTVDGNIIVGPTSEPVEDPDDVSTSAAGLAQTARQAARDLVRLPLEKTITSFAGLRAHLETDDFVVEHCRDVPGLVNCCGIESPGLTAAPAIAEEAMFMVFFHLRPKEANHSFNPIRRAAPRFRHMSDDQRREAIARDPDYGHIVCRCENVTKAEIVAALRSPLGVRDLGAIKRRTRAGMGRCQAGFCSMRLPEIVADELKIPLTEVTQCGDGSRLLSRRNKT